MTILFYVRANHDEVRGGDLVQIYATAKALGAKGVKIDFSSDPTYDLSGYDLIHVFNSPRFRETLDFVENGYRQNVPVALSTIFWPKDELAVGIGDSDKAKLMRAILGKNISRWLWRYVKYKAGKINKDSNFNLERKIFNDSGLLLPNSEGEMKEILSTYGLKDPNYQVVCNAIDPTMFKKTPAVERSPYVLSVGRVDSRKNTLKLVDACHRLGLDLTVIGGADPGDVYAQRCLSLIKQYGFTHIAQLDQSKLIPHYYNASVHAMVSWYETPGLSSMEAACGGCTIVSTELGSTKEYFGDEAIYCDPFSQSSIEHALETAMQTPYSTNLRQSILKNYTWDKAADDTLVGYKKVLR